MHEYKDNLCGVRDDDHLHGRLPDRVFTAVDAPDQERTITFVTPVSRDNGAPMANLAAGKLYSRFEDDIEALIELVEIDQK